MAERLKLSKGWLSKMLKAATIPDTVLSAFSDLSELTLNPAYALASALDDHNRAQAIVAEAGAIATSNAAASAIASPPLAGAVVLKRLMDASSAPKARVADTRIEIAGQFGRPILAVKSVTRQGVTLHLPTGGGASDEQLQKALQTVLETLRQNGVSLA